MIIVWSPVSCNHDESTHLWVLVELAADPTISADDVKATGPLRTQRFGDESFELASAEWTYREQTFDNEQAAIDAWQAWDPNALPPEEPPPEEPAP